MSNPYDVLLGRTVVRILMEPGEARMRFVCADGDLVDFVTDADCCSETWFADLLGVHALLGETINVAEESELPQVQDGRGRQDEDRFYGFKLFTSKGCCDVIYRNSSNGYYGGDCDILVNGISAETRWSPRFTLPMHHAVGWTEITDDWQA